MLAVFDIGGTNTRVGVSADGKTIKDSKNFHTNPADYDASISELITTIEELADGKQITGAAGGFPGPLLENKTIIGTPPNLPKWHGKPFVDDVSKRLDAPVFIDNDTATIGLGEATAGAGKGHEIVVYITVSTGVGGCRIVNKKIDKSARGFEPGHQIIVEGGPTCACGGEGHLEALIGGASMEKRYGKPPKEIDDPKVWDTAAKYLAIGLNNIIMLWSPHVIVFGGSMMKDISLEKTEQHVRELVTIHDEIPQLVPIALDNKAGFIGGLKILENNGVTI